VASDARVVRRVLWIAVPKVILHRAQIGALVRQAVAAIVAQHLKPAGIGMPVTPAEIIKALASLFSRLR
jgi:hypothetical protein